MKSSKKKKQKSKLKEKISMYEMIISEIIAGKSIIEPSKKIDNSQIAIGFSNIASENQIKKYFMITQLPDYIQPKIFDLIRCMCIKDGVKISFYIYGEPYKVNWDSPEMKSKVSIWKEYSDEVSDDADVFEYRAKRKDLIAKQRIIQSTRYLNESELDYRRSLVKTTFLIAVSANRNNDAIINMADSIEQLKEMCLSNDISIRELSINMIDWIKSFSVLSLKKSKEMGKKIAKKVVTDDILASMSGYKQGRVGKLGVPLGIDVLAGGPVLYQFKEDPNAPENWVIASASGGGKSYFIKILITYLLATNFVVTVMDYEGDEYNNLSDYINSGKDGDSKVISMGKGSTVYFDPMEIPDITGNSDIDSDLKETAINYTMAIFRLIVCGLEGEFSHIEERIISNAITRVYDSAGVTNDKSTWVNSKGLRLKMVYEEIKIMAYRKDYAIDDSDGSRQLAINKIRDASYAYFEDGEAYSGTFKNAMSANELYKAKFIVFSFGMRGASNTSTDPVILALKQLSVACVSTQISNYCKYIKHCFNVKVWEEFQRWGDAKGSSDIIINAMTGGRKRGDVNFIVTNNIASLIDETNPVSCGIAQNIQNWAIGKINGDKVRKKFCESYNITDCEQTLKNIAIANSTSSGGSKFHFSFCVILNNGKRAVVKAKIPKSISRSKLLEAGVDIREEG